MNPSAARRGEIRTMPYTWPEDTDFALWELDVVERRCPSCGRMMHVCDHRYRRFHTLRGPVELLCRLNHCPDPDCPGHARIKSPGCEPTTHRLLSRGVRPPPYHRSECLRGPTA